MLYLIAALWGLFGGFGEEGIKYCRAVARLGGVPWRDENEPGLPAYLSAVLVRLLIGAGLAVAVAATLDPAPLLLVGVGYSAPKVFTALGRDALAVLATAGRMMSLSTQEQPSQPVSDVVVPAAVGPAIDAIGGAENAA